MDYEVLKQRIAQRCVLYFNNFMRGRGYTGALKFDLENKRLEIFVRKQTHTSSISIFSSFSISSSSSSVSYSFFCSFR